MKRVVKFIAAGLSICILTNNVVNSKAMDLNSFSVEDFKGQIANNTFKKQIPMEFVHEHLINIIEELQDGCNSFQFNNNDDTQDNDNNNENDTQDNDNHNENDAQDNDNHNENETQDNEKLARELFELIFEVVEGQFILNEKGEYTFDDGIPFFYQVTSMVIDRLKNDKRINRLDIKNLKRQFEAFCGSAQFLVDNEYYEKTKKNIPTADWSYLTSSMLKAAIKNNSHKASNFLGSKDEHDMYLLGIIVKDNLDAFKEEQVKCSLSGSSITEKKFDVCFNINCFDGKERLEIIDLSALLGSEKIFKFLLLQQHNKLERNTYECAIRGGNTQIIRIAENIVDEYDVTSPFLCIYEITYAIKTGQINVAAHVFNKHISKLESFGKETTQEWLSKGIADVLCDTYNVLLIDRMLLNSRINKSELEIRKNLIKIKYKPLIKYFINKSLLFGAGATGQVFNPDEQWIWEICKPVSFESERVSDYVFFSPGETFQFMNEGALLTRLNFLIKHIPELRADMSANLLYLAVKNQDLESVEALLNNELYQEEYICNNMSSLIMALDKNNEAISRILLKEILGGNEYIEDVYKLFLAIKNDEMYNFHNLTKKLSKDILLKINNELMFFFAQKENIDGIKFCLNQGINEFMLLFIVEHLSTEGLRKCDFKCTSDEFAISSISNAIRKNDLEKVKYLLEHTINKQKLFNGPLMYEVIDYISAEMLQLLIDEGENLYLGNPFCDKTFSRAVERNCLNVVKFLLEKNLCSQEFVEWFDSIKFLKVCSIIDFTLQQKMEMICDYTSYKDTQMDIDNNTLFSSEILNKKINELQYLPEHEKNIAKKLYEILEKKYKRDELEFLYKLIREVEDPRFLEKAGTTLLHYLVRNSNNEGIKKFIDYHPKYRPVDLNVTDKDGQTALCLAVKLGKLDVVRELIEEREVDIKEPMFDLATRNAQMTDFFLNLINLGDLRILEKDGTSILHYLIKNSNKKDIKQFLNRIHKSVDLNATDKDGQTALCLAVKLGKFDAVKALIKHGADTNIPIRDLARGNTEMINFFSKLIKEN